MQLVDLRQQRDRGLLAQFIQLYERTFEAPELREDPALWLGRMWGDAPEPAPIVHIIVAVDGSGRQVIGGVVCEYYRASGCGLVTYLVVTPTTRRTGIGRQLVSCAAATLRTQAAVHGRPLQAVFAEAADPARLPSSNGGTEPGERLSALARLGARRVDIPYVQPDLGGGAGRVEGLWLLSMGVAPQEELPGPVLRAFLHEFYRSLGVADPDADADFQGMIARVNESVSLSTLQPRGKTDEW
ncbi:MAG: GNAT family N-acetyltransferase [Polyangiales bacterium]